MELIEEIKSRLDIVSLANQYGAKVGRNGSCKHNPMREERTVSLKIYPETNSYTDFGNQAGGDVIDFFARVNGLTNKEAIIKLKEDLQINSDKHKAPLPQVEYMSSVAVRKIFDDQVELDFKKHKKYLEDLLPYWVYKEADIRDVEYFQSIVKKSKHEDTLMLLLRDYHNQEQSIKYRYKMVGENMQKWVSLAGTKSNILFTNITENPITIVTEGSSDYRTAILLGYSVISIPSASYKGDIPLELTQDRIMIFIGDDGEVGQEAINRLEKECVCDKKRFIYDGTFKGGDFKDIVCEFNSIEEFKDKFDKHITNLPLLKNADWQDFLDKDCKYITRETIREAENARLLYAGILPHKNITTFVGKPNVGKSAITMGLINYLFYNNQIENLLYFDRDNSLSYTKDRILALMDKHGDEKVKYFNGSTSSTEDMFNTLHTLPNFKGGGSDTLIVIDSLKNFVKGSINDDKSVNDVFDLLQNVRDRFGATIIVLHHTRKGKTDEGDLVYVGSQVIEASSDNMFMLQKNTEDHIVLTCSKMRAMLNNKTAFELDFEDMTIVEKEIDDIVNEEKKDGVDELQVIKDYLEDNARVTIKDIKKDLKGKVTARKIDDILQDKIYKEKYFKWEKIGNEWVVSLRFSTKPEVTDFSCLGF